MSISNEFEVFRRKLLESRQKDFKIEKEVKMKKEKIKVKSLKLREKTLKFPKMPSKWRKRMTVKLSDFP